MGIHFKLSKFTGNKIDKPQVTFIPSYFLTYNVDADKQIIPPFTAFKFYQDMQYLKKFQDI